MLKFRIFALNNEAFIRLFCLVANLISKFHYFLKKVVILHFLNNSTKCMYMYGKETEILCSVAR